MTRIPWICVAGLHDWRELFYVAGRHFYRCDRCGMERAER